MPILSTIASRAYGLIAGLSGIADIIVNYLIGTSNSDIYASETGTSFLKRKEAFGTTPINTVSYDPTNKFFAAGNSGKAFRSTDGNTWTSVDTGLGANNLRLFTHNGRSFIASSTGNLTTVSTDGVTWTTITINHGSAGTNSSSLTTSAPTKIVTTGSDTTLFGNPGNSSYLLTSNNPSDALTSFNSRMQLPGATWSVLSTVPLQTQGVKGFAYGNGNYVAAGGFSSSPNVIRVFTSTDAVTWTTRSFPYTLPYGSVGRLEYGNGMFVASFNNGIYSDNLRSSTDGVTWTTRSSGLSYGISCVRHYNNTFFAIGSGTTTSTDGITWTVRNQLKQPVDVSYSSTSGLWAVVGYRSFVWTSPDLVTWTTRYGAYTMRQPNAMYYEPSNNTTMLFQNSSSNGPNGIYRSTDGGVSFTGISTPIFWGGAGTPSLSYGNGIWITGTSTHTAYSADNGSTWTTITSLPGNLYAARYINNRWMASFSDNTIRVSNFSSLAHKDVDKINSSTLGIIDSSSTYNISTNGGSTYSRRVPIFDNETGLGNTLIAKGIAYGNGTWVAVYNVAGQNKTSTDGITWVTRSHGVGQAMRAVSYGNGIFVSVGSFANILTSTNGITWTSRWSLSNLYGYNDVSYNGSNWVATGGGGSNEFRLAYSTNNGTSWTGTSISLGTTSSGIRVSYGNGVWVSINGNRVIRSTDNGASWTLAQSMPTSGGQAGLLYESSVGGANGTWVFGDTDGRHFTSTDNGVSWVTRSGAFTGASSFGDCVYINGRFVACTSGIGRIYTSTDAVTWTNNQTEFSDTASGSRSSLFIGPDSYGATPKITLWNAFTSNLRRISILPLVASHDSGGKINYSKINKNLLLITGSSNIFRYNSTTANYDYINTGLSGLVNIYTNSSNNRNIAVTNTNYYSSSDLVTWTTITGDPAVGIINSIDIV